MTFFINFDKSDLGVIPYEAIHYFSFKCSIFKLYAGAKVSLMDVTKTYNNKIKMGMSAQIVFLDDEDKTYVNNMRVLSVVKKKTTDVVDSFDIVFISAFFFDDAVNTMTYSGSVSGILSDVFTNVFKDSVPKIDFSVTEDRIRRRYQLSEKTQDFVKKIIKYGIKENMPVYLYSSADGTVYLRGVSEMINGRPRVYISSILASQLIEIPEDNKDALELIYYGNSFNSDIKKGSSRVRNIFCTKNFKFPTTLADNIECNGLEYGNSQTDTPTSPRIKFYNWNYTPDDAKAIAVREAFEETVGTFTMSATFMGMLVGDLNVGSTVMCVLPYNPTVSGNNGTEINMGEGKYLITSLSFNYEDNNLTTEAIMSQVSS